MNNIISINRKCLNHFCACIGGTGLIKFQWSV